MARYLKPCPETNALNQRLTVSVQKMQQALEDKIRERREHIKLVYEQSLCEHAFFSWWEEDYDGHRVDATQQWTCTKCKYSTAWKSC